MCSPNKGTLKFCEIRSNKGIFPLFTRFPYLKNFSKNVAKSQKLLPENKISDLNNQKHGPINLKGATLSTFGWKT